MTEEESPIIDFYPTTFEIDMNGKKMAWQGVALLPFIDQNRLLEAMAIDYPKLTDDQARRNAWGNDVLFVSDSHSLYPFFESLYGKRKNQDVSLHFHMYQSLLNLHLASSSRSKDEQRHQR
jgi:5'-3' exoribonuclease 2